MASGRGAGEAACVLARTPQGCPASPGLAARPSSPQPRTFTGASEMLHIPLAELARAEGVGTAGRRDARS